MRVNWQQATSFGFGMSAIFLVWPLFNQFVPLFLQAGNPLWEEGLRRLGRDIPDVMGFGLAPTLAFFIMTWDNILNLFVQPWAGMKSDGTWTRFGRRKPWIMVGVPVAAVGFVLIPLATTVFAILLFIFVTNLGMALFRAPTAAWLGDLFPLQQQSKVRGMMATMSAVAGILALVVGSLLFEHVGRAAPFIWCTVLMLVAATTALVRVRETPPDPQSERGTAEKQAIDTVASFRAIFHTLWKTENHGGIWLLLGILLTFMMFDSLTTGISSFAVFTLGLTSAQAVRFGALFAIAVAVFAIPSGLIGTRIGPGRTMRIGLVGVFLVGGSGYFWIQSAASFAITLVLLGALVSLVLINDLPLFLRFVDQDRIGANTGVYFIATQAAAVLGPTLAGFTIEIGGNYRLLFVFIALCALAGWGVLWQVRGEPLHGMPTAP